MKKYTDELVLTILSSDNPKYDGSIKKSSYSNSHLQALLKIADTLDKEGFSIGKIDSNFAEEAAFNFVTEGHIVFFNVYDSLAFLKLPKTITKRQYEVLKIIENELQQYFLYEQKLDPINPEVFDSIQYNKNYKVLEKNYTIKEIS